MLPVCTDWFVTRNASTSPSVRACAGPPAPIEPGAASAAARRLLLVILLVHLDPRRVDRAVRLHVAFAVDRSTVPQVAALRVPEVRGVVRGDRPAAGEEGHRRTLARQ